MINRAQVTGFDWNEDNSRKNAEKHGINQSETLLNRIKIEANKRDMPYQSLIKAWLADEVNDNRRA
jgi:predicted DNA binding CopG/RHH family protein